MKKTVGIYGLGPHSVRLILDFSTNGGCFTTAGKKDQLPEIEIGADQKWEYVVQVLMHELFEMALSDTRGRFRYVPDNASGSDSYVFHFDHNQLSEAAARVGSFVSMALPDAAKVFNKFHKK